MESFDKYLPVLNGMTITAALAWFLWWKSTIHKEIVKPSIDAVNTRVDTLQERLNKLEELYIRMQDNLEHKLDKLQETTSSLSKEVAEMNGQLKAMQRSRHFEDSM